MKRQFSALSVFVLALGALAEEAEGDFEQKAAEQTQSSVKSE
jgi:hypothetical protein